MSKEVTFTHDQLRTWADECPGVRDWMAKHIPNVYKELFLLSSGMVLSVSETANEYRLLVNQDGQLDAIDLLTGKITNFDVVSDEVGGKSCYDLMPTGKLILHIKNSKVAEVEFQKGG